MTSPARRIARLLVLALSLSFATPGVAARPTVAATGPALTVDASKNRHAISPDIYGVNFADATSATDLGITVDRWGGNGTTRYNYQTDTSNHASDWYFENIPPDNPDVLPHIALIKGDRKAGMRTVLTVPMIGWTPKAGSKAKHPYACGFKVTRYGGQDSTDPYDTNCGNGLRGGDPITDNQPSDTSTKIGAGWVKDWVRQLVARFGTAAQGGVAIYQLDNEPTLWNSTHRDVHPKPTTYNELMARTISYANAIKSIDPTAKVLGPGDWGWCSYFYSAADSGGCGDGPDRQAHGGMDYAPWYLRQLAAYQRDHGVRLLDYFDEHFYPQSGIALRDAGDASMHALRLRQTRSLWDPTYIDESWISDLAPGGIAVKMLPRMRAWVAAQYPGTKCAITEYNFGGLESMNGALAQADVLGIFGREKLSLATLWGAGSADQPWAFAFRMYRNYDGHGRGFGTVSVRARSLDASQPSRNNGGQDQLSVYAAQRGSSGALTVIVINKTGGALMSNLKVKGFAGAGAAQVWRYSGADLAHIVRETDAAVSGGSISASYPANSITLLVLPAA